MVDRKRRKVFYSSWFQDLHLQDPSVLGREHCSVNGGLSCVLDHTSLDGVNVKAVLSEHKAVRAKGV